MNCREFVEFIMAYLEGDLPEPVQTEFQGHVEECPECVDYLDSYRETVTLGKSVCRHPDDPVPEDVPESLVQAILAARSAGRRA